MAKRGQHSFLKRQKEIKRKERAGEKMARRQGKARSPGDATERDQALTRSGAPTSVQTEPEKHFNDFDPQENT